MSPSSWIAHICEASAWEEACRAGEYRAASLEVEGFIHASRPEQVIAVANRFYRESPKLVLLRIDPARLTSRWQEDPVEGQRFPHVYGPINLNAVIDALEFSPDADGWFRMPPGWESAENDPKSGFTSG